ncbi:PIN domain-containing protein [Thiohalocapsa sp. ML1]|jgi:predicted nucleic acid-binding protein|uniref:PIN domain-containing protein n=1 Tax=Thiohalocapsa sp. ML1 TaxID=1431688 RepID=UPI000731FB4F|nr:PIN domain-containing protein [Thiohalocapsa sp. ML1]
MTPRYGIDTSVLVRLVTGDPEDLYALVRERLTRLVTDQGAVLLASNQVIGEAYIAVQHHYGITKAEAREGLRDVLRSGLVAPLNGSAVLDALAATGGCGLLDRLIANDYARVELRTLTLDRRMAQLPEAQRLVVAEDQEN